MNLDGLAELGKLGPLTILALVILVGVVGLFLFAFRVVPKLHGQAMNKGSQIAKAIEANTSEIRASRTDAETRHAELMTGQTQIMTKLEAIHTDFLSDADTAEHRAVGPETPQVKPGEIRRPPQHRELEMRPA